MTDLLSIADVCRLLSIHKSTLWRLIRAGKFAQPLRLGKQLRRWRLADVEAFLVEARS
jgi:excisionase family DNA binding protein